MKNIILITLLFLSLKLMGQSSNLKVMGLEHLDSTAWLPQKFIEAVLLKDSSALQYLSPIEGFQVSDGQFWVNVYKSEANTPKIKKNIMNGRVRYQVLIIPYFFYMVNVNREYMERYSKAKYYLSKEGENFRLEIVEINSKMEILFVNTMNGHRFTDLYSDKKELIRKMKE